MPGFEVLERLPRGAHLALFDESGKRRSSHNDDVYSLTASKPLWNGVMRRSHGRSEGSDQFVMSGAFDVRDQFTVSGSEGAGSDDSDLGGMGSGGRKEDTGQN